MQHHDTRLLSFCSGVPGTHYFIMKGGADDCAHCVDFYDHVINGSDDYDTAIAACDRLVAYAMNAEILGDRTFTD